MLKKSIWSGSLCACRYGEFGHFLVGGRAGWLFLLVMSVCGPLSQNALVAQEISTVRNAPLGYTWVDCHSGEILLLKPVHWFYREAINTALECYLTKEKLNENDKFSSGISVSIKPKFRAIQKLAPKEYAKRFTLLTKQRVEDLKGRVIETWNDSHDSFGIFGVEYTRTNSMQNGRGVESIRVRQLSIGNDINDTFILIIFESPVSEWDQNWEIAEPILNQLGFNPDTSD